MELRLLRSEMNFSHRQFLVYDRGVLKDVAPLWTKERSEQGFARRESTVAFATLVQLGIAEIVVCLNSVPDLEHADRAVEVPFRAITGDIAIEGPVESGPNRAIHIAPGEYRLVAVQQLVGPPPTWDEEPEIAITLYFERLAAPLAHSSILVADDSIRSPPDPLLETAEVAYPS
jgi:hypothetical protein